MHVSVFCPPEVDTPMTDYMADSSPRETRALVRMTGRMSAERAARILLAGIRRKKFLIVPGFLSKWFYLNKKLNPALNRIIMDMIVTFTK
jgi:short-subunit dehydrogenase